MSSGRIADLTAPRGENASYQLEFRAPQLKCSETVKNVTSRPLTLPFNTTAFFTTWNKNDTFSLFQERYIGFFAPNFSIYHRTEILRVSEIKTLNCKPQSALFNLNISYVRGIQHASFSVKDVKPFRLEENGCFFVYGRSVFIPASCNIDRRGRMTAAQNISLGSLKRTLESWNVFAPLDAMLRNMQYNFTIGSSVSSGSAGNFTLDNGTIIGLQRISENVVYTCKLLL